MIAFLLIVIFLGTIENKISKFSISEYSGLYKIELLMSYINISAWYLFCFRENRNCQKQLIFKQSRVYV